MRNDPLRPARWRLLSLLAVLALVAAACGSDSEGGETQGLEFYQENGVVLGMTSEAPYAFKDDEGNIMGAAPSVAIRVLDEIGIEVTEGEIVEFGALIGGLQAGNYDMITAGMYINADRAGDILFSDPDYCIQDAMLVEEGNPFGLTNYNSVAETDAVLAVASGTVNPEYARWAGIPEDQIEEFAAIADQYDAIAAGRVDAVSGTILTVQEYADSMDGFEATEQFWPLDEDGNEILGCGGHGFLDTELRDAFNDALNELQDEGVIAPIVDENLGVPAGEQAIDLTVQDLTGCADIMCTTEEGG